MTKFTNQTNIPLPLAVWLATDGYDYDDRPNLISATSLLRSIKQITLSSRIPQEDDSADVSTLLASRMGTAIHDSIENAWLFNRIGAMLSLGYPKRVIERMRCNPEVVEPDTIPFYMEKRSEREIDGKIISGKFDFVLEGKVIDFKSTSTFSYTSGTNTSKYKLQGSIYRWLNPELITDDVMEIHYIFKDWSRIRVQADPNYPKSATLAQPIKLMSVAETDAWVREKVSKITKYANFPEEDLPKCTDEDLWRKPDVWKYYKNPAKTIRATKNFNTRQDALMRLAQDKNVGLIKKIGGEVMACRYCPAVGICKQKDGYIISGELKM